MAIPVFDSVTELMDFATGARMAEDANAKMLTAPVLMRILISGLMALMVNVSNL